MTVEKIVMATSNSGLNSTYFLISEERPERKRREGPTLRIIRERASEEHCRREVSMLHLETCFIRGFIHYSGFSETLHSQYISSWINIVVLFNVSLNFILFLSWLFVKISFLSLFRLLFLVVHEHRMQENSKCRVYQMNMEFRSKIHTKMILRSLPTSIYSNTRELAPEVLNQFNKIQKWLSGRVILEIISKIDVFESFCSKPII